MEIKKLKCFSIIQKIDLYPYDKDHFIILAKFYHIHKLLSLRTVFQLLRTKLGIRFIFYTILNKFVSYYIRWINATNIIILSLNFFNGIISIYFSYDRSCSNYN